MEEEKFDKIVAIRLHKIEELLLRKSKEYAFNGDRLWNFKQAARFTGQSQQKALWGIAAKHFASVDDLVNKRLAPRREMIDEKIGDLINYLIILEAVFIEENNHGPMDTDRSDNSNTRTATEVTSAADTAIEKISDIFSRME